MTEGLVNDEETGKIVEKNYQTMIKAVEEMPIDPDESKETVPAVDPINPSHYRGKIEVIDFIEAYNLGFCLGNVVKYVSRAGKKYPDKEVEDLRKASWYLERRIKELEGKV